MAQRTECFSADRYCVQSQIKISDKIANTISDIKLTVHQQQKKFPNSMSEVNVRKWHGLISAHFSSKIGHVKIKLDTTLNIFTQSVAVDLDRFVFVFVANPANGSFTGNH